MTEAGPDASRPGGARRDSPVVAVVGAGVSGLAAARVLAGLEPATGVSRSAPGDRVQGGDVRVVVLESGPSAGGKVASGELAGHLVEVGPDQFLRRDPSAEQLCRLLGLGGDLVAPAARSAGVWSRGSMRGLPGRLVLGVPTDLDAVASSGIVSPQGVARAWLDGELDGPVLEAGDVGLGEAADGETTERSAGEILRERLGDEIVDRLVDPLLGGINAGSIDTMSLGTAAPQIARALVGHRDVIAPLAAATAPASTGGEAPSPFFGMQGGLARLVAACCAELEGAGVEIRTSSQVTSLRRGSGTPFGPEEPRDLGRGAREGEAGRWPAPRWLLETDTGPVACDGVVLAVPGFAGAALTKEVAPELAAELGGVPYATVAVVTLAFDADSLALPPGWTGALVPRIEGKLMTATTWLSVKWPWMSGSGTRYVRVSAGRFGDGRIDDLDDDELAAAVTSELREIAGIGAEPFAHLVTRFERSFPQYLPGHARRMARAAAAAARTPGIELAGAVLGGIGIPACVTSGEAAAERVSRALRR